LGVIWGFVEVCSVERSVVYDGIGDLFGDFAKCFVGGGIIEEDGRLLGRRGGVGCLACELGWRHGGWRHRFFWVFWA
jgi:hypothetical protein